MKEIRTATIEAQDGEGMTLTGRAIVFGQPTVINDPAGSYNEVIDADALAGATLDDTTLTYAHDMTRVPLARTPKTMKLFVSPAGLDMVATLANTEEARTVYESVKRGDLKGMSFAFSVPEGGDEYDPTTNTRTIRRISKLYEISIVPYPAYPQTSVEARSAMQGGRDALNETITKCNLVLLHN